MIVRTLKAELKTGKTNNSYWAFDFKTTDGSIIKASLWESAEGAYIPNKSDFLEITHYKDQLDTKFNNIVLQAFKKISPDDIKKNDLIVLVDCPKADPEDIKKSYINILNPCHYEDKNIFKFVETCYQTIPIEKWVTFPAAASVHHAYQGGLLIHTSSVLNIAKNLANSVESYPFVNNDLVCAGAALHDIGKTKTYLIDELGLASSSHTEKFIGHIYYGMSLVESVAAKTNFLTKTELDELLHIISSHHGDVEKGSIKPVMSIEALIVSQADYLDSRISIVDNKIKETKKTNPNTTENYWVLFNEPVLITDKIKEYIKDGQVE